MVKLKEGADGKNPGLMLAKQFVLFPVPLLTGGITVYGVQARASFGTGIGKATARARFMLHCTGELLAITWSRAVLRIRLSEGNLRPNPVAGGTMLIAYAERNDGEYEHHQGLLPSSFSY